MTKAYHIPAHTRFLRAALTPIFRGIFRTISQVEIDGLENIPTQGAYIIVFNHVSIFDPPLVVAFWPTPPEVLGADDVWNRPGQATLARLYGGIPIRRGQVDREAMDRMMAAVRTGHPLLISPEGGRSHIPGLRQAKSGVVYVIERTGVPVVPVGVVGTTDDFFQRAIHGQRPHLEMHVGQPFVLPAIDEPDLMPKENRQRKADFIMHRMAALLPANYRGVYGHLFRKNFPPVQTA